MLRDVVNDILILDIAREPPPIDQPSFNALMPSTDDVMFPTTGPLVSKRYMYGVDLDVELLLSLV